jgi:hypothetical protein
MAAKKSTKKAAAPKPAVQKAEPAKIVADEQHMHDILGVPQGLTQEQHENQVRKAALGF